MILYYYLQCAEIASHFTGDDSFRSIEQILGKDPGIKQIEFLAPDDALDYPEYSLDEEQKLCDALIPIKRDKENLAVLHVVFSVGSHSYYSDKMYYELLCAAFNPSSEKTIVRKGTQWGEVELRWAEGAHVNYYRPDKATLYTDRVLQYCRPEEIDEIIESELAYKGDEKLIDEHFELNYPMFKLRVRLCDAKKLSHEQDADGIWWVNCPRSYDLSRKNTQMFIREYFKKVLLSAAEVYFPQRVEYMESKMVTRKQIKEVVCKYILNSGKYAYNHIKLIAPGVTRDDGSRILVFDPSLLAYPVQFCDKVIIHELCHNLVTEHNRKFDELENNWCLAITGKGPHYYDEFLESHELVLFAEEPFQPKQK